MSTSENKFCLTLSKNFSTVGKAIVNKWRNWKLNNQTNIIIVQSRKQQMNDTHPNENIEYKEDAEHFKLFKRIFNIICRLSYFVGFDVRIEHTLNIRLVLAFILSMSGALSTFLTPFVAWPDIPIMIQSMCLWGMSIPALLKYLVFVLRRERVYYASQYVEKIFKNLPASRGGILIDDLNNTFMKLKWLMVGFVIAFTMFAIYPVYAFATERILVPIMKMEYPFIDQTETVGYAMGFGIMFVTAVVASSGSVCFDLHLAFAIFNYGALVRLFNEDLKDYHKMWENKKEYSDRDRNYYIRNICLKYQDISAYLRYVNAFYSNSICCSVCSQYAALIFTVYSALYNGWMNGYGYCLFLLLQLYILCYLGTYIEIENANLNRMIYFAPWYEYSVAVQQVYRNLLHASSFNATVMWIGPFAPLNVQTGKKMTSNIYSYNTAMASMTNK